MPTLTRSTRAAAGALAVAALVGTAGPIAAQDPSMSPEQIQELQDKTQKFVEFLQNQDAYLPTVNLIDATKLPATFPYKDIQEHVVVDVAMGDGPSLPFMFDTGAGTLISAALRDANPSELVVETIGIAGGNNILITPTRRYPSLTVADSVTVTDVLASDPWEGGDGFHCITPNGLLGASSMQHAVWQVDYGTQQISVAASVDQLDHIKDAIAVPFSINQSNKMSPTPYVTLPIGNGQLTFIVDTGGGIPMTIEPAKLASVGVEVPGDAPTIKTLSGGAAGSFEGASQFMRMDLPFGDTDLSAPVAVAAGFGAGADGNIGHGFLKNFVVTFDFPNQTMYLSPLFEGTTVPDPADPVGAGYVFQGGKVILSNVPMGSPADQAGVKVGDVITEIDGQSVAGITADDYCAKYATGSVPKTITTEAGLTVAADRIAGFWKSID
ncbi:MAG: PDZ domain-containing protein [Chloroflexota bacterium]